MPTVTASIVVHDTPVAQLAKVLGCLESDGVNHIFVIDNSDNERLRAVAESCDICTYSHVENRGFGAGHNIGIELARHIKSESRSAQRRRMLVEARNSTDDRIP